MYKKIKDLLKNEIYESPAYINTPLALDSAKYQITDNFFKKIKEDKAISKKYGVELISVLKNNVITNVMDIFQNSAARGGVTYLIKIEGVLYSLNYNMFKETGNMRYNMHISSESRVLYGKDFIERYIFYCGLEISNVKGSYFSLEKQSLQWVIKDLEKRSFNDIFLPDNIISNLHMYVNIFKSKGKLLRFLKVGNPGVGKTESTIIIANELKKLGVTIIKTSICSSIKEKVRLAKLLSPSLIIFDDIDMSLGGRDKGGFSPLLGDFLDILDGTDKVSDDVGIIATTNAANLLDLAAQRPGRFDKTLLYDDLSKDNIKSIIKKSLDKNFKIKGGAVYDVLTNDTLIDKYHSCGVSGAHVYNSIKMIVLKHESATKKEKLDVDLIIKDLDIELKTHKKVRNNSYLNDKFNRNEGKLGFALNNN